MAELHPGSDFRIVAPCGLEIRIQPDGLGQRPPRRRLGQLRGTYRQHRLLSAEVVWNEPHGHGTCPGCPASRASIRRRSMRIDGPRRLGALPEEPRPAPELPHSRRFPDSDRFGRPADRRCPLRGQTSTGRLPVQRPGRRRPRRPRRAEDSPSGTIVAGTIDPGRPAGQPASRTHHSRERPGSPGRRFPSAGRPPLLRPTHGRVPRFPSSTLRGQLPRARSTGRRGSIPARRRSRRQNDGRGIRRRRGLPGPGEGSLRFRRANDPVPGSSAGFLRLPDRRWRRNIYKKFVNFRQSIP